MQNALQFNGQKGASQRMIQYVSDISNDQALSIHAKTLEINSNNNNPVLLGNQSGIQGHSNVTVNDLTLHSMGDQKLTDLLKSAAPLTGFSSSAPTLNFNIKTGNSGGALITVYGARSEIMNSGIVTLSLYQNGTIVRQVSGWVMEWDHGGHHSSAQPSFPYAVSGLKANTVYSGFAVAITGAGALNYVAYSVIPF